MRRRGFESSTFLHFGRQPNTGLSERFAKPSGSKAPSGFDSQAFRQRYGLVAQQEERSSSKRQVRGSSPREPTHEM